MKDQVLHLRVAPALKKRLMKQAEKEKRSLTNLVLKVLEDYLNGNLCSPQEIQSGFVESSNRVGW